MEPCSGLGLVAAAFVVPKLLMPSSLVFGLTFQPHALALMPLASNQTDKFHAEVALGCVQPTDSSKQNALASRRLHSASLETWQIQMQRRHHVLRIAMFGQTGAVFGASG